MSDITEVMDAVTRIIGYAEMDEYIIDSISITHKRNSWDRGTSVKENKEITLQVVVKYVEVE